MITKFFNKVKKENASLPYGPPMNRHYYQTFLICVWGVICVILVLVVDTHRREASACLILLSDKQGNHWYNFQCLWYGTGGYQTYIILYNL